MQVTRDALAARALLRSLVRNGQKVARKLSSVGHRIAIDYLVERGLIEVIQRPTRVVLRATEDGRKEVASW